MEYEQAHRAERLAEASLALNLALLQMITEMRMAAGLDPDGTETLALTAVHLGEQARLRSLIDPSARTSSAVQGAAKARRAIRERAPALLLALARR